VILDADLAAVYGVPTKRLNEQVRRNRTRFPVDFMFRLEPQEVTHLRSQIATSNDPDFPTSYLPSPGRGGRRYAPYAFTEHGALMAATVLNSPKAVQMSLFVVRAFVKMREQISTRSDWEKRVLQIENVLLAHDDQIRDLYEQIRPLLLPPPEPAKKGIGFHVREARSGFRVRRSGLKRQRADLGTGNK